jgi:hypothetical protein
MSQSVVWETRIAHCAFCGSDVPVLTLGTLDDHDPIVVRAFRERVRRALIALGDLTCESQGVFGLVWLG